MQGKLTTGKLYFIQSGTRMAFRLSFMDGLLYAPRDIIER